MAGPVIYKDRVKDKKLLETVLESCPVEVFEKINGEVKVKNPGRCIKCRVCESLCNNGEIKVFDD